LFVHAGHFFWHAERWFAYAMHCFWHAQRWFAYAEHLKYCADHFFWHAGHLFWHAEHLNTHAAHLFVCAKTLKFKELIDYRLSYLSCSAFSFLIIFHKGVRPYTGLVEGIPSYSGEIPSFIF